MNGHTLTSKVRDFSLVLQAIDERQVALAQAGQSLEERQLELAHLGGAVDARQAAFVSMSFWQRLRWIVRGI